MADAQLDALARIERTLNAILGIQVEQFIRETGVATPRPRSIDRMLNDFGYTGAQIATLLGKSPQAVSQALARGKAGKANKAAGVDTPDSAGVGE